MSKTAESAITRKGKLEFTASLLETASRTQHTLLPSTVEAAASFLREFISFIDAHVQAIREAEAAIVEARATGRLEGYEAGAKNMQERCGMRADYFGKEIRALPLKQEPENAGS